MHRENSRIPSPSQKVRLDASKVLGIDADATPDQAQEAFENAQAKYAKLTGADPWVYDALRQAHDAFVNPRPVDSDLASPPLTLSSNLPLQNETTYFILANVLDIFMTFLLLNLGAVEANPIAAFIIDRWGFSGMIVFKLVLVAAVCVISQVVATRRLSYARGILWTGIVVVGIVVVYSLRLLVGQTT